MTINGYKISEYYKLNPTDEIFGLFNRGGHLTFETIHGYNVYEIIDRGDYDNVKVFINVLHAPVCYIIDSVVHVDQIGYKNYLRKQKIK